MNIRLFHIYRIQIKVNDKPGLFCVEPNSPPVLVVVPNADVPKPPVVPNPVSVATVHV